MKVKSYAKLNLTLNVSGVKNGFHDIDSLVTSVDIYDVVNVDTRNDGRINVEKLKGIRNERNAAYKAADAFIRRFGSFGVDVVIDKGIPFGAGMGGSSADAAAVIYCMCKLFDIEENSDEVQNICAEVGSDVSFMLRGGFGRMRGKG
ncbi:MAG: 4-(cytidine 5'-diphospho)-2-C-methyl-D-erythritol kinase, partial [Firmicutes bacterium]|nr:4-(cytidine 5'-diphospho)-2-C-methyl-D-erythritol kinase [Bacillota bacterium]